MPKYYRDPECLSVYYDQHLRSFNDIDVVVLDRADWERLVGIMAEDGEWVSNDDYGDVYAMTQTVLNEISAIIAKVNEANSHE